MGRRLVRLLLAAQGHHARATGQAINGAVAAAASTSPSRTARCGTTRLARSTIVVSNYGEKDLAGAPLSWKLVADGKTVADEHDAGQRADGQGRPRGARSRWPAARQRGAEAGARRQRGRRARQLVVVLVVSAGRPARSRARAGRTRRVKWAGIDRALSVRSRGSAAAAGERPARHVGAGRRRARAPACRRTRVADGRARPDAGARGGRLLPGRRRRARDGDSRSSRARTGFPHEGFADLQFFNLMDGAVPIAARPMADAACSRSIGGIRTTAGFLSKIEGPVASWLRVRGQGRRGPAARDEPALPRSLRRGVPGGASTCSIGCCATRRARIFAPTVEASADDCRR